MQAAQKTVRIGSTMLAGTGKEGILKPDAQGYYRVPVGAYNSYNSGDWLYDRESGLSMFKPGSQLMRQVEKGVLYGEYKHPEYTQGMSDLQYLQRIKKIDMDRVSHHIREYELIPSTDERGRAITLVVAHIRPWGPFGQYVEDGLKNSGQNVYFSVRSITMDDMMRRIKYTKELITHDFVGEGGIFTASKYNSPALEEFDNSIEVTPQLLKKAIRQQKRLAGLGLENNAQDFESLQASLGWNTGTTVATSPVFMNW